MTDFDDDFDHEGARDGLSRKLRTEGAVIAYDTAVSICRDPKATAAAKASAVNSLFRAAGFFANREDDNGGKQPSEMTADEIDAALRRLRSKAQPKREPAGGLFD